MIIRLNMKLSKRRRAAHELDFIAAAMRLACDDVMACDFDHPAVAVNLSLLHSAAMERIKQLSAHLTGSAKGLSALERKNPDDVVVTMAIRSPLCKARKGGFKDTRCVANLSCSSRF